jgi:NOL1/NOP2/fmu family ribosome biogenesis protein
MIIEFLSRKNKREIQDNLKETYGIDLDFPHALLQSGKDKLRIFTGDINEHELQVLNSLVRIDAIGLYFGFLKDKELRLSLDSSILLARNASKNILELNKEQAISWMQGKNLNPTEFKNIPSSKIALIKYKDDILGVTKLGDTLWNFVPKERRTSFID